MGGMALRNAATMLRIYHGALEGDPEQVAADYLSDAVADIEDLSDRIAKLEAENARLKTPECVMAMAESLAVLDRAWEHRCDSYDPWPDNDLPDDALLSEVATVPVPPSPHDAAAQHVFDLLRAALAEAYQEKGATLAEAFGKVRDGK